MSECEISADSHLRHRGRLWIPDYEPLTTRLIQQTHDSAVGGHPGRDNTFALVSRQFFWPGQSQQVRQFVRNCDICGSATVWRHKKSALLKPLPVPDRIWSDISIDFITDLPISNGHTFCQVITDRLGKGVMYDSTNDMTALGCAERFVQTYVRHHGFLHAITRVRGSQWVNRFWKRVCELTGIKRRLSTAYHPETDGATERANQELEHFIRCFTTYNQTDWSPLLPIAELCTNNRISASTGFSPFFLTHGYNLDPIELKEPLDPSIVDTRSPRAKAEDFVHRLREAQDVAQTSMALAQQRQEDYANRSRQPAPQYKVNDSVWLNLKNITTDRPVKKFDWLHAKYRVTKVVGSHAYELNVPRGIHKVFHASLLRPTASDPLPSQLQTDVQPAAIISDGDDDGEYLVEEILQAKTRPSGHRYALVKWVGWQIPTWEPISVVTDTIACDHYEARYGDIHTNDGPARPDRRRRRGVM